MTVTWTLAKMRFKVAHLHQLLLNKRHVCPGSRDSRTRTISMDAPVWRLLGMMVVTEDHGAGAGDGDCEGHGDGESPSVMVMVMVIFLG